VGRKKLIKVMIFKVERRKRRLKMKTLSLKKEKRTREKTEVGLSTWIRKSKQRWPT
jgi:hypothetical protein